MENDHQVDDKTTLHKNLTNFFLQGVETNSINKITRQGLDLLLFVLDASFGAFWYDAGRFRHGCRVSDGLPKKLKSIQWKTAIETLPEEPDFFLRESLPPMIDKLLSHHMTMLDNKTECRGVFCFPVVLDHQIRGFFMAGVREEPDSSRKQQVEDITRYVIRAIRRITYIQHLQDKNKQLEMMIKKPVGTDMSKLTFMSTLTHELKTPLNSIIGFADLLLSGSGGEIPEKAHEFLVDIKKSGLYQLNLVKDLLSLIKLDSGTVYPQPTHVALYQLMNRLVEREKEKFPHRNIMVEYHLSHKTENLFLDGRLLQQLLANLINNAFKFSHKNGVIRIESQLLTTPREDLQPSLYLAISDHGIGISANQLDRLFLPFSQIDQSFARQYGGTGLGLYICKRICDIMGGTINVESTPDKGSTFFVTVPLMEMQL